jgi:protein-L-isoaspartate(D-aspartate) O-methyltransferase
MNMSVNNNNDNEQTPEFYEKAREKMVKTQLVTTGVQKKSLIDRMATLERESFTPQEFKIIAYSAREIPVLPTRYMIDPMNIGLLLDKIDFDTVKKIMILGDSTGYVAALLSEAIDNIVTVDNTQGFSENVTALMTQFDIKNVTVFNNDIALGCPDNAPFDLIFINGAVQQIPDNLFAQLSPQGKVLTALKKAFISEAVFQYKLNDIIQTERLFECSISLLPEFSKKSKFVF